MRQSTVIFGVLILAFVIYITMRGQLPAYLALFSSSSSTPAPQTQNDNTSKTIDWGAVAGGDLGAIGDLVRNTLPKVGF